MTRVLCVDFGSTFTKAALVDTGSAGPSGELLATREVPTTIGTDVLDGYRAITGSLAADGLPEPEEVLACSSAGGGLRLAVVGYERDVTAQAGYRVGLSAGAKVVHVAAGPMSGADVHDLRAARPDIVLLVGGTDGGNADVLVHNAERLARMRVAAPIVVAGNADAADDVASLLASTGRRFEVTDNVLPQIGVIEPRGARAAIRAAFLQHVIGGKHLSRGSELVSMVRAATPDAVLAGVQVLADSVEGDVLVIDVGGATTDVYSALQPQGEDAGLAKDVVAPLWQSRTVEADLGMRWSAEGVLEAAEREALPVSDGPVRRMPCAWPARRRTSPPTRPSRRSTSSSPASPPSWRSGATPGPPRRERAPARSPTSCTSSGPAVCSGTRGRRSSGPSWGPSPATTPAAGGCRGTRGWRRTRHTCSSRSACWRRPARRRLGRLPCALSVPSPRLAP